MNARRRKDLHSLAFLAALVGCAPIPAFTFGPDGDSGAGSRTDATISGVIADGGIDDGGPAGDSAFLDLPFDDAGAGVVAPGIKCGSGVVANCSACAGSPLRCRRQKRDECVADCQACAANWFPCLHCPTPDAAARGNCVPVGQNGQVACALGNLCACNVDTDCPVVPGAAQTCDVENGRLRCLTCGAPTTANAPCVSASGTAGVCRVAAGSLPKCN